MIARIVPVLLIAVAAWPVVGANTEASAGGEECDDYRVYQLAGCLAHEQSCYVLENWQIEDGPRFKCQPWSEAQS